MSYFTVDHLRCIRIKWLDPILCFNGSIIEHGFKFDHTFHSAEYHTEMVSCRSLKVLAGIILNNYHYLSFPLSHFKMFFKHSLKAGKLSRRVQDGENKHKIRQCCFEPTIHIGQQTCTQTISSRRK